MLIFVCIHVYLVGSAACTSLGKFSSNIGNLARLDRLSSSGVTTVLGVYHSTPRAPWDIIKALTRAVAATATVDVLAST